MTELTCLGPTVPYGRPDRDPESDPAERENLDGAVDLTCHQRADDGGFLERQRRYLERLRELTERGLPWSAALQLLQTWTAGACVHLQRALPMAGEWTRQVDGQVMDFLGGFLGERPDELAQEQAFLPVRLGGLGLASAAARQDAAWVGAWEDNLHAVAEASGAASLEAMRAAWPQWAAALAAADARLAAVQGAPLPAGRWAARVAEPAKRAQHAHTLKLLDARHRNLLGRLVLGDRAALAAGSGPGAGAFLQGGAEGEHLGDAHLRVALRRRLRYRRPVPEPRAACQHKDASGRLCGVALHEDNGKHALVCTRGGGVMKRHNAVRDALGDWLTTRCGRTVTREQAIPHWARPGPGGEQEAAVLDLVYSDPSGRTVYVDVSVVDSSGDPRYDYADRHAIQRRETSKHHRYPGAGLVAYVLDNRGAPGKEAEAYMRAACAHLDPLDRADALAEGRRRVSVALQQAVAEQIMTAHAAPARHMQRGARAHQPRAAAAGDGAATAGPSGGRAVGDGTPLTAAQQDALRVRLAGRAPRAAEGPHPQRDCGVPGGRERRHAGGRGGRPLRRRPGPGQRGPHPAARAARPTCAAGSCRRRPTPADAPPPSGGRRGRAARERPRGGLNAHHPPRAEGGRTRSRPAPPRAAPRAAPPPPVRPRPPPAPRPAPRVARPLAGPLGPPRPRGPASRPSAARPPPPPPVHSDALPPPSPGRWPDAGGSPSPRLAVRGVRRGGVARAARAAAPPPPRGGHSRRPPGRGGGGRGESAPAPATSQTPHTPPTVRKLALENQSPPDTVIQSPDNHRHR